MVDGDASLESRSVTAEKYNNQRFPAVVSKCVRVQEDILFNIRCCCFRRYLPFG